MKACFSKYLITVQTHQTQIVVSILLLLRFLTDFQRLLVYKINYLSPFVSDLSCKNALKARYTYMCWGRILYVKSEQKWYEKSIFNCECTFKDCDSNVEHFPIALHKFNTLPTISVERAIEKRSHKSMYNVHNELN